MRTTLATKSATPISPAKAGKCFASGTTTCCGIARACSAPSSRTRARPLEHPHPALRATFSPREKEIRRCDRFPLSSKPWRPPMREAVIVSTARTPIGRAYRGAFNDTQAQTLGGHAIAQALARAHVDGGEVDDVVMGAALQQGSTGYNFARQCALRAGLPTSVAGMSVDRQCASGLMAISIAAKEIVHDGMSITVGGGLESISLVQNDKSNRYRAQDGWLVEHRGDVYMSMLET